MQKLIMSSQKVALREVLLKLSRMMKKNEISELNSNEVKSNLNYNLIPEGEKWRLTILQEVLQVRAGIRDIEGFEKLLFRV